MVPAMSPYSLKFRLACAAGAATLGLAGAYIYDQNFKKVIAEEKARSAEIDRLTQQELSRPLYDNPAASSVQRPKNESSTLEEAVEKNGRIELIKAGIMEAKPDPISLKTPPALTEYRVIAPQFYGVSCYSQPAARIFAIHAIDNADEIIKERLSGTPVNMMTFHDPSEALDYARTLDLSNPDCPKLTFQIE